MTDQFDAIAEALLDQGIKEEQIHLGRDDSFYYVALIERRVRGEYVTTTQVSCDLFDSRWGVEQLAEDVIVALRFEPDLEAAPAADPE